MAEAFVVSASRAQHVRDVIAPALLRGAIVLCDRFGDATLAYQGFGRGLDLAMLRALVAYATGGCVPDLTFLVDIDVALSRTRVAVRSDVSGEAIDRLERESTDFHERVRAGYLELARGDERFVILDGTASPAELRATALRRLGAKLT